MFKVAVAQSIELDSAEAVGDVLEQCRRQLGDSKPQAGLLFTGIDHDFPIILETINAACPDIELIGCTTDGEISSVHGYADDSIVLTVFCSDELTFKAGVADNISRDPIIGTKKGVDSVVSAMQKKPVLCITTPTGLTSSGDSILEGLKLSLGETFPVFGGSAADQLKLKATCQFYRNRVYADALPFLLIAGPLEYSFGVDTGWHPIGVKEKVTKSKDNTIYEIGKDTALQFYKQYLGEDIDTNDVQSISDYPLAIFEEDGESFYLRAVNDWNPDTQSCRCMGNVPEGSMVQIAHATRNKIIEATHRSVAASVNGYPGEEPAAALCFSCATRKMVLGTRVEEEYQVFKKSFPDLPVTGFYTYGEFAPLGTHRPSRFHNEAFVNLILGLK